MPIPIKILQDNGFKPVAYQADSLRQAAAREPAGVYTVTRTYPAGRVVLFDAHLDRLEESARLEGIPLRLDRPHLRTALAELVREFDAESSRVRLTVPREQPDSVIIAIEPLTELPRELKREGVKAATVEIERENPRAKSNQWEHRRQRALKNLPPAVHEGLLVDERGAILEGFTSNFFAIIAGELHTADDKVLLGISRKILLTARPSSMKLVEQPVLVNQLSGLDESFLTSSSRGVVPIVSIDDQPIGSGRPGPLTEELCRRYDRWVEAHLESIEPT